MSVGTSGSEAARLAEKHASARNFAGLQMRAGGGNRGNEHLGIVAEQRSQRRAAAIGRQVPHLNSRRLHEQRHRQMQGSVEAGGAEDDLVRALLGVVDELLQRLVGLLVVDDQHHRSFGEARDRYEVGARELRLPAEQLVDLGEARDRYDVDEERVAVGICGGGELRADLARRAGLGLDHHRLLEQRLQHGREGTRDHVGGAARREWIDDGNGARRIGLLGECRTRQERRRRDRRSDDKASPVYKSFRAIARKSEFQNATHARLLLDPGFSSLGPLP